MAAPADTPDKLIAAAERLFAEHGYTNVSVRAIAAAAGVNWSLVGYCFRGKEGLLSEVYRRHCSSLNAERLKLLGHARQKGLELEAVIEAFVRPALAEIQTGHGETSFSRLRAILAAEDSTLLNQLVADNFDMSSRTFVAAFANACRTCLPTRFSGGSISCSGRFTTRSPARSGSRRSRRDAAIPAISRTRSSTSCRSSPPRSGHRSGACEARPSGSSAQASTVLTRNGRRATLPPVKSALRRGSATLLVLSLSSASAGSLAQAPAAGAHHTVVASDRIRWKPLRPGAEIAVVSGDPNKEGSPFVMRFRYSGKARIPPHWHPTDEHLTVLSGTFRIGMGERGDESKTTALGSGAYAHVPAKMAHYAWADEGTTVQVHGIGPFAINYADDPASEPRVTEAGT